MFRNQTVTDGQKIEELLTMGVEEIIDRDHLKKRLLKGDRLRVKLGIDPTSFNIHIGRAMLLWKLREFQNLGHKAVFIVGDFTGQIGDTSDKESERPMLSEKEIKQNMRTYFEQAYKILDRRNIETRYNSNWLRKLGFLEIGRMADRFGLHEISARELIKKRLDAGTRVSAREVLYPLMQGYDSVAVKADVELGGTDQRFNLLAGRITQPLYGQTPQDIVIMKFPLLGLDGRKMSSSWGNVINITDEPNDMFGKVMSVNDDLIVHYFEMAMRMPADEVKKIEDAIKEGDNPLNAKLYLAEEIVKMYHGVKEAQKARKEWDRVFSRGELPIEMEEVKNKGSLIQTTVVAGIISSNSEAKRLIEQKAIKVNNKVVETWEYTLEAGDVVQIGPKKFVKIK